MARSSSDFACCLRADLDGFEETSFGFALGVRGWGSVTLNLELFEPKLSVQPIQLRLVPPIASLLYHAVG